MGRKGDEYKVLGVRMRAQSTGACGLKADVEGFDFIYILPIARGQWHAR